MHKDIRRFAQLANRVWGVDLDQFHPDRTALKGIEAMESYFTSLGMPRTLTELGVPKESWQTLASMTTNGGTSKVKSYDPLGVDEILEIYRFAERSDT